MWKGTFTRLFAARVSYETTEHKIRREFEAFGQIKRVRLVSDSIVGKPRVYAFSENQHTRDMKTAYKQGDGRKIDNRRVLVDVECRTVPSWRPRRLGEGSGSTRVGGDDVNQQLFGREPQILGARATVRVKESTFREQELGHEEKEQPEKRERDHDRDRDRERDREREKESGGDRERGDRDHDRHADRENGCKFAIWCVDRMRCLNHQRLLPRGVCVATRNFKFE